MVCAGPDIFVVVAPHEGNIRGRFRRYIKEERFLPQKMNLMSTITFPEKGRRPGAIMEELEQLRGGDIRWKAGKTWSLVYYLDEEHDRLLQQAYDAYFSENYLNSFAFPSLQQMEREVVRMTADMLNGPRAVGAMTSGGTESILLAVNTCREWSKQRHRNGRKEILAPATVHPAFEKAAHLFGLNLVRAPVLHSGEADVEAMARLIGRDTLMLVASAPCYPYGIVDPVEKVAALAAQHGIPLHVDACVGGFVLPWAERLGYWNAPWDFRVPGVTSVSLDVHKFGFAAKGASLVMYRDMELMKHQFFVSTEFCGGIYVSPTLLGTRPGGAIAAAWASIRHLGAEGYVEITRRLMEGAERLKAFFRGTPGLELVGGPRLNLMAFRTTNNKPDIYVIGDFLEERGWMVDRQQRPACIHLTVMPSNLPSIEAYERDVCEALAYAREHPEAEKKGNAALYGLMARLPFRGVVGKNVVKLFEDLYRPEGEEGREEPGWMGAANRLLAAWNRLIKKGAVL
jgi:sphinganine-1-phosphate aldolase